MWQIGAFVRPWGKFSFEEALAGVAAAGYPVVGLLGGVADISLALDGMDTAAIQARLAGHGLTANLACLHVDHNATEGEAFASLARQVDSAKALGVRYLMTFGADHEPQFARWYAATHFAATQAEAHGIQVVFKPHGGCTAAADEIEHCFDQIAHPNVSLWFDAGNIIHYTDKDPVVEARRVAARTSGVLRQRLRDSAWRCDAGVWRGQSGLPQRFRDTRRGWFLWPGDGRVLPHGYTRRNHGQCTA